MIPKNIPQPTLHSPKKRFHLPILFAILILAASAFAAFPLKLHAENTVVTVYKSPTCACCEHWIQHMKQAGFELKTVNTEDTTPIRNTLGIPHELLSCHTAVIGNQWIEGHVPAADIQRFLKEKPLAKGLSAPGMPTGSPGMAVPGKPTDPFDVIVVLQDGSREIFNHHPGSLKEK